MAVFLVVDDEPSARVFFETFLHRLGHKARMAGSYVEAVQLMQTEPWDVAIVDILFKGEIQSGIDVLRIARDVAPESPILMVTGAPTLDSAKETVRLGAFDYVEKPIDITELEDAIRRALKYRELLREKRRLELENSEVRQRLEAIFDSVLEGIVTVDRNGVVLALNSAAAGLFNVIPDKAVGMSLRDLCIGDREAIASVVEDCLKTGDFVREYQISSAANEGGWTYIVGATPLKEGAEEGAVLVIQD
ncbi:MAG: response regulator [bacterium]